MALLDAITLERSVDIEVVEALCVIGLIKKQGMADKQYTSINDWFDQFDYFN